MSTKMRYSLMRLMRKPFVTYAIVILHIVLFVLMEFNGGSTNSQTLLYFGAKSNILIVAGEWWRLITPMFLHIGIMHLIMNTLVVYFLGSQLEEIYGHWRFALIYFMSGIFGNALSFAFNDAISAGASTAIFGLFVTTLVLANERQGNPAIQAIARNYFALIVINIIFNLFDSSVDLAGHIGGLIGGYLSAKSFTPTRDKSVRYVYILIYVIALILVVFLGYMRVMRNLNINLW